MYSVLLNCRLIRAFGPAWASVDVTELCVWPRSRKAQATPLSEEEIVLMGGFAGEPAIGVELTRFLSNPATRNNALEAVLKLHARLQNPDFVTLVMPLVRTLAESGPGKEDQDLFLKLAAAFRLSSFESEVVRLTTAEAQTPSRQVLGLKALSEMGAKQLELFQRLAISSTNEPVQREAITALSPEPKEIEPCPSWRNYGRCCLRPCGRSRSIAWSDQNKTAKLSLRPANKV